LQTVHKQLKKIKILCEVNAFLRSKIRERRAKKELNYYRKKVKRTLDNNRDISDLFKKRFDNRKITIKPKKRGQLHIFVPYYLLNWESVIPKTLRLFGKVAEFNWAERNFDERPANKIWVAQRERMNEQMLQAYFEASRVQPVDAVVGYLSGLNTSPQTVQKMADAGSVIFNFCWDDKLSFRGRKLGGRWTGVAAIASSVDLNLTNAPDSIVKYAGEDGIAMFWPEGADPDVHKPYDLPFEYDVSFVGQKYGWRPAFIKRLGRYGINVTTFGSGWENGPLSEEEMIKLYSKSRINLGFSGVRFSKKLTCLKGRDFEVPMSGGLYLTQDNPELSLVYKIGEEIVTYRDEKDCAEKIRWLLADREKADRIRKAARERALKEHTWSKRFEQIFVLSGIMGTD
jgi:hypothetical protein